MIGPQNHSKLQLQHDHKAFLNAAHVSSFLQNCLVFISQTDLERERKRTMSISKLIDKCGPVQYSCFNLVHFSLKLDRLSLAGPEILAIARRTFHRFWIALSQILS